MNLEYLHSQSRKQKAYIIAFAFLFFVIPVFPLLISPAVILIFITALFQWHNCSFKGKLFPFLCLPVIFYFIYVIGLAFTQTPGMMAVVLERKLSLLVFPAAFLFLPVLNTDDRKLLWKSFIAGVFLYSLISLSSSFVCYLQNFTRDCFFSSAFSYEIHPSYSAFYLIVILSFLLFNFIEGHHVYRFRIIEFFLFFWFSLTIFLLASKAGLICYGLLLFFGLAFYLFKKRNFRLAFILAVIMLLGIVAVSLWNPVPVQRLKNSFAASSIPEEQLFRFYGASIESNVVRRMIWICGAEIIRENPWGVGSGDANVALMKKYEEKGMTGAMSKEFNAHNQFLQTSIALGIAGGIFFIMLFVVFFFHSIKTKNLLLGVFLIFTVLNLLVESMFETESGIVFIVLFLCFLYVGTEKLPKFNRSLN